MAKTDTQTPQTPAAVIKAKIKRIQQKQAIQNFFVKLIAVVVFFTLVFTLLYGVVIAKGEGMYPSIRDGDVILYYRLEKEYFISDIVTFRVQEKRYFSRIVAQAGDTVDLTEDGGLLINGNLQQESVFYPTFVISDHVQFPYTVPKNNVFVLGDHRTDTVDSRELSSVSLDAIDGKIMYIVRRRGL